jgi:N-acetylmuramic acid 6-phosphate etherase
VRIIEAPKALERTSGGVLKNLAVRQSNGGIGAKLSFQFVECKRSSNPMRERLYLGIEGGGTKTIAVLTTGDLRVLHRAQFGPGNFRLLSAGALENLFRQIAVLTKNVAAIGIGLAGVREDADRKAVRAAAEKVWGQVPLFITHDLQIALGAASVPSSARARVLVLSGTGSCCYGEDSRGETAKVGGWGHLLGDLGSGYDTALRGLKAVIYDYDRAGRWGALGAHLLRELLLNTPNDLIAWAQSSDKAAIARLAPVIFECSRDPVAREILAKTAQQLAGDALICARRLARRGEPVAFVMAGGVLQRQPAFARQIGRLIKKNWASASIQIAADDGAVGAAKLAIQIRRSRSEDGRIFAKSGKKSANRYSPEFDPLQSPTEQRNGRSLNLDKLSLSSAVDLMLEGESEVIPALRKQKRQIERTIAFAWESLKSGGRIFYAGAGTSGRLGVLDASECPPTFRASPEMVQGIIAGGQTALWKAVEGAEDDWEAGAASVRLRQLTRRDTLIGIAASGRTPFVWGALAEARKRGSRTVLLCFNPSLKVDKTHRPDLLIAPNLGPEILTGSTRLKCGTATKLVLNMISTISMVRLGKVMSNLMVDLNPSNSKLRDRAVRIVGELTDCSSEKAASALEQNNWIVKDAVATLGRHRTLP